MFALPSHILPGVDDGPASLEEALDLARFCVHDGITHIAATPHRHRHLRLLRADILPPVARFQEELAKAGLTLIVLPVKGDVGSKAHYGSEARGGSTACR